MLIRWTINSRFRNDWNFFSNMNNIYLFSIFLWKILKIRRFFTYINYKSYINCEWIISKLLYTGIIYSLKDDNKLLFLYLFQILDLRIFLEQFSFPIFRTYSYLGLKINSIPIFFYHTKLLILSSLGILFIHNISSITHCYTSSSLEKIIARLRIGMNSISGRSLYPIQLEIRSFLVAVTIRSHLTVDPS